MKNNVVQFKRELIIDKLPDDLMTISEFATLHGCSKSLIYKLKNNGRIRLYPIGHFKVSEKEALKAMGV